MRYALSRGADIIVKLDADGQMNPRQIPALIRTIENGSADYVKGDRFFFLTNVASMPAVRMLGNLTLSFMTKLSSGYWTVMDPTNGFFAIHARVAELLVDDRISKALLLRERPVASSRDCCARRSSSFRCSRPMAARSRTCASAACCCRSSPDTCATPRGASSIATSSDDFSLASLQLVFGAGLFLFGLVFGLYHWMTAPAHEFVPTGTIMIAAITFLMGFQLLMSFVNYDISAAPREPLHPHLEPLSHNADEDRFRHRLRPMCWCWRKAQMRRTSLPGG